MDEKVIKALFEPKRFLLVRLMAERSYCVRALAYKSGISEPAVSQHLKVLREAGLVSGVKKGYYTHYRLEREALTAVIDELTEVRDVKRKPCEGTFRGCPEAEAVKCRAFSAPEKRETAEKKEAGDA
ncbi:MAG: helix-turn-helix transcriptional regulator [Clostridia bacterium]|nr:helix-turn-helix transcriptional regulator [Clostridia bacterium]